MPNTTTLPVPDVVLCTLELVRRADRSVGIRLAHMPAGVMAAWADGADAGCESAEVMRMLAVHLRPASDDVLQQACALEQPINS